MKSFPERDQSDPHVLTQSWDDRYTMIENNQRWIEVEFNHQPYDERYVVMFIRWCKWWAGMRSTRPNIY